MGASLMKQLIVVTCKKIFVNADCFLKLSVCKIYPKNSWNKKNVLFHSGFVSWFLVQNQNGDGLNNLHQQSNYKHFLCISVISNVTRFFNRSELIPEAFFEKSQNNLTFMLVNKNFLKSHILPILFFKFFRNQFRLDWKTSLGHINDNRIDHLLWEGINLLQMLLIGIKWKHLSMDCDNLEKTILLKKLRKSQPMSRLSTRVSLCYKKNSQGKKRGGYYIVM